MSKNTTIKIPTSSRFARSKIMVPKKRHWMDANSRSNGENIRFGSFIFFSRCKSTASGIVFIIPSEKNFLPMAHLQMVDRLRGEKNDCRMKSKIGRSALL
jgi:hypothetical protein